jgi:hypothetical protein
LGDALGIPAYFNVTLYVSIMVVAVGFLSGKGGVFFVIGGYLCYFILAPMLNALGLLPSMEMLGEMNMSMPSYLRLTLFRPVGIGMLIGGAITGIVLAAPLIKGAIKSMHKAAQTKKSISKDEMPIKLLYIAVGVGAVILTIVAYLSTAEMGIGRGIVMAVIGSLWIWVV